ncbi:AI-2E family transporter [Pediococcus argentinicus]|nr:AI-2E family transporter [Pediococcus argentinicus]NKZ22828.1 AI-2E family transporter [Pediococcus argentinicus]GEP19896.1 AI-2E family transporter [Pediococcus argentinicus]
MFEKLRKSPLMFWSVELLIAATLIYVCTKINFLFSPIGTFISTVFIPLILAMFLYYMLNPLVKLLMRVKIKNFKISRTFAVVIVFLGFLGLIAFTIGSFVPGLIGQITDLLSNLPKIVSSLQDEMPKLLNNSWFKNVDLDPYIKQINSQLGSYAEKFLSSMTTSLGTIISTLTNVTIIVITVPVILFYMLKDGYKLTPTVSKAIPKRNRENVVNLFGAMSETLSSYIGGQVIECLFVGTFTIIGYMIIGQPYGMLLGVIAGICNIIPYVGPYFGIFPSLLVAISKSPMQIVYVIIVVLIVQQVDGNLVYPNVIGKSLQIHPLTIIMLLLAAGKIAGIFGMILAVPTYAIVKVLVNFGLHIWRLNRTTIQEKVNSNPKE